MLFVVSQSLWSSSNLRRLLSPSCPSPVRRSRYYPPLQSFLRPHPAVFPHIGTPIRFFLFGFPPHTASRFPSKAPLHPLLPPPHIPLSGPSPHFAAVPPRCDPKSFPWEPQSVSVLSCSRPPKCDTSLHAVPASQLVLLPIPP